MVACFVVHISEQIWLFMGGRWARLSAGLRESPLSVQDEVIGEQQSVSLSSEVDIADICIGVERESRIQGWGVPFFVLVEGCCGGKGAPRSKWV